MRRFLGKFIRGQILKILLGLQIREQLGRLNLYVLRKTECAALLGNSHCSRGARPVEYILEQMMMDRAKMREIKVAFGQRFAGSRAGNLGFKVVEFALVA
jgi:hypothetical protein